MAESQQASESTQAPAPSPSPKADNPLSGPPQAVKDRQVQRQAHEDVDKRNPLSALNRAAKREAMLNKLRGDRGVPEPKHERASEPGPVDSGSSDAGSRDTQRSSESGDVSTREKVAPSEAPASNLSQEQVSWMRQQQDLREAEQRAREASTTAEKRKADAEMAEARAAEKIKKMELAMSNPAEFMSEAGMTQDEWNAFWANGGKLSPEQKRMREMEAKMNSYAEKLAAIERQAQEERAHSTRRLEDAEFTASLKDYTFLPEVGGIGAVRNKQAQLMAQNKGHVTLKEAADVLEAEVQEGIGGMLKKQHILAKLGLATASNQPPAKPATKATTLTARTAGDSTPKSSTVKGPLDWAGKRQRYLDRLASDRAASRDR